MSDSGVLDFENLGKASSTQILFGDNRAQSLILENLGERTLVVCSKRGRVQLEQTIGLTPLNKTITWFDSVENNPGIHFLENARSSLDLHLFDVIIGFGGGSAIDVAKILASTYTGDLRDQKLLKIIQEMSGPSREKNQKLLAIPTTAGTGAEVTSFAAFWDFSRNKKYSLSGAAVAPDLAIVDPVLSASAPLAVKLASGLDALNQCFESLWNKNSTSKSEKLAAKGVLLGLESLERISAGEESSSLMNLMSQASLLSGLAIDITKTAICHSISYPITVAKGVEHGLACAFTMPLILEKVLAEAPEKLSILLKGGEVSSFERLQTRVSQLVKASAVDQVVRDVFDNQHQELISMAPEMIHTDRGQNFILEINLSELRNILEKSFYGKFPK